MTTTSSIIIYSLQGLWSVEGILTHTPAPEGVPPRKAIREAFEVLREVAVPAVSLTEAQAYLVKVIFKPQILTVKSPTDAPDVVFELQNSIAEQTFWCIDPGLPFDSESPLYLVAFQTEWLWEITDAQWPVEIASATVDNQVITPAIWFETYLGLAATNQIATINWQASGVLLSGAMEVPWNAPDTLPGAWHLLAEKENWILMLKEHEMEWYQSLATYQDAVVDATDLSFTAERLPSPDTPAVGLIATPLPQVLQWNLREGVFSFDLGGTLFAIELRGAALSTVRVKPQYVSLSNGGAGIHLKVGEEDIPDTETDVLHYTYEKEVDNRWHGEFALVFEEDAVNLYRNILEEQQGAPWEEQLKAWVLTPTGPLQVPVAIPQQESTPAETRPLKSILRLSEIPWLQELTGDATPEITKATGATLLVTGYQVLEMQVNLVTANQQWECQSVSFAMATPGLRLENALPVYLPPETAEVGRIAPPSLPSFDENEHAEDDHTLSLSFFRAGPEVGNWRFSLSYAPGAQPEPDNLQEGNWQDSSIVLPDVMEPPEQPLYWYSPPEPDIIPLFPYDSYPGSAGSALRPGRLYMPLYVKAEDTASLRLISQHFSGTLAPPDISDAPGLFGWFVPALPGLTLHLSADAPIKLENGLLKDGETEVRVYHEIPGLQELYSFQTTTDPEAETETPPEWGMPWWEKLAVKTQLATTQTQVLCTLSLVFQQPGVLVANQIPVVLSDLLGPNSISGFFSLHLANQTASVEIETESGDIITLIGDGDWLRGAETPVAISGNGQSLYPAAPDSAVTKLVAGTLTPVRHTATQTVLDGFGHRQTFRSGVTGSPWIEIPVSGQDRVQYALWSLLEVELNLGIHQMNLFWQELPVREYLPGEWKFMADDPQLLHPLVREYRWGTLEAATLGSLNFQVMQLEEVHCAASPIEGTVMPVEIMVSGILHARNETVSVAIPEKQRVRVVWSYNAQNGWAITAVSGRVWWPLFEPVPDLSGAKAEQEDVHPYLEAVVGIENGQLALGLENEPAYWVLDLLGQRWYIPVQFEQILPGQIEFSVMASENLPGIYPTGGNGTLDRTGYQSSVTLKLGLQVELVPGTEKDLCQLFWDFHVEKDIRDLQLVEARLLQLEQGSYLAQYTSGAPMDLRWSDRKIALLFDRKEDSVNFQWLSGLDFDASLPWKSYLSIALPGPDTGAIQHLIPAETTFLLSGSSSELLDFIFVYQAETTAPPVFSLSLTGELAIANDFRWPLSDTEFARHRLRVLFHEAALTEADLVLSDDPGVFFTLADDGSETDGYVTLPAMVTHSLMSETSEAVVLEWVVPQDIRLLLPNRLFSLIKEQAWPPGAVAFLNNTLPTDTLYWEAGEAHWLQPLSGELNQGQQLPLWIRGNHQLMGIPGPLPGKGWYRLALPVLSDTSGKLAEWIAADPARQDGFSVLHVDNAAELNLVPYQWPELPYPSSPGIINGLLATPGFNSAFPAPSAYALLYPYTQTQSGFLWGGLVFDPVDKNVVFWEAESITLPEPTDSPWDNWWSWNNWWDDNNNNNNLLRHSIHNITVDEAGPYWLYIQWQTTPRNRTLWIEAESTTVLQEDDTSPLPQEELVPLWLEAGSQEVTFWQKSFQDTVLTDLKLTNDFASTYYEIRQADEAIEKSEPWVNNPGNILSIPHTEWMKFQWQIPEAGRYWMEFSVATIWKDVTIRVYLGNPKILTLDIPKTDDWNVFRSVWAEIDLPAGDVQLRVRAWGWNKGLRLERVSLLQGIQQLKDIIPPMAQPVLTIQHLADVTAPHKIAALEKLPVPVAAPEPYKMLFSNDNEPAALSWPSPWVSLIRRELAVVDPTEAFAFRLQVWQPQFGDGIQKVQETTFIVGVLQEDTWAILLGLDSQADAPSNPLRKAIADWVAVQTRQVATGALLVAKSTVSGGHLPDETWFLLGESDSGNDQKKAAAAISSVETLARDLHWEAVAIPADDPLSSGPDFAGGNVYYEPGTWTNPVTPSLPPLSTVQITAFTAEPEVIALGDSVTLSWSVVPGNPGISLLLLDERSGETWEATGQTEIVVKPEQTTIYALRLYNSEGVNEENARVGVAVRRMVSGSGLGMTWQFSGSPAGFQHWSRMADPAVPNSYHRWVEWARETAFQDLTRDLEDGIAELGILLPGTRKLVDLPQRNSLMPARASLLSTHGRPGGKQWWRMALLRRYADTQYIQRTSGWGGAWRFPRPVPLPEALWPVPQKFGMVYENMRILPTCTVTLRGEDRDFAYFLIRWSDPYFDRQLLAVSQSREQGPITLTLDRKVYGPKDVCYPDIKLLNEALPADDAWRVVFSIAVMRPVGGQLQQVAVLEGIIEAQEVSLDGQSLDLNTISKTLRSPDNKEFRRIVLEVGLDKTGDGSFLFPLLHQDQLEVSARLETPQQDYPASLSAQINTQDNLWSPPTSGVSIFRKVNQEVNLATHGWAVPPLEVKRINRFRPDKWSGLFAYWDVVRKTFLTSGIPVDYEVRTTTPDGEQAIHLPFSITESNGS